MRQAVCYLSHTGKAFQQPLACLKSEFDHLVTEFRTETQALILHHYTDNLFYERLAALRQQLATIEAKAKEYYTLRDSARKPAVTPAPEIPENVIPLPREEAT